VRHLTQFRVARILHEAAVADLRVGEHLRVVIDRAARQAGRLEHFDPVVGGTGCQHRIHHLLQRVAVRHARLVGRKSGSSHHSGCLKSLRTTRPDRIPAAPTIKWPSSVCMPW